VDVREEIGVARDTLPVKVDFSFLKDFLDLWLHFEEA
jgi:hypothetical protein